MDCGIFGIVEKRPQKMSFRIHRGLGVVAEAFTGEILNEMGDIGWKLFYALKGLQHRGQASSGMAVSDNAGLGHDRYPTAGLVSRANIQPIEGNFRGVPFALGHNGNLINTLELKMELLNRGIVLEETASDTRIITKLIETSLKDDFFEAVEETLLKLSGAFSLIILYQDKIIGVKDPFGIRPLCLGENEECYALSSESCAFDHLNIELIREIEPGELIVVDAHGVHSKKWHPRPKKKICLFEYIYFARPDSIIDGVPVYRARKLMGQFLANEHPSAVILSEAIVPVLDSALMASLGLHEFTNLPLRYEGLFRAHFTFEKRTFIEDEPDLRELGVNLKFNPVLFDIQDKHIILIDDSIVRGTTAPRVIRFLRTPKVIMGRTIRGAKKIYFLLTSPPYLYSCWYGIDTGRKRGELIAKTCGGDISRIRDKIGADYLGYLSIEKTVQAVVESDLTQKMQASDFCTACFSGEYPIPQPEEIQNRE